MQVEGIFEKIGKQLRRQSDDNDSVTMCDCVGQSRVNSAVRAWWRAPVFLCVLAYRNTPTCKFARQP